jgi:exodeoxyribonuclease VII small subunit
MVEKNKKKPNFENSLEELETLVDDLESGDLSLDESIKKFETGVKLYKNCKDQLSKAEKKIKVLTESLNEEDYETENE